jgi:flagellar biosynthesis/type III secretory pathway protein FliH
MTITEFRMNLVREEGFQEGFKIGFHGGLRQARELNKQMRIVSPKVELILEVTERLKNWESAEKIANDLSQPLQEIQKIVRAFEASKIVRYKLQGETILGL